MNLKGHNSARARNVEVWSSSTVLFSDIVPATPVSWDALNRRICSAKATAVAIVMSGLMIVLLTDMMVTNLRSPQSRLASPATIAQKIHRLACTTSSVTAVLGVGNEELEAGAGSDDRVAGADALSTKYSLSNILISFECPC